MVCRRFIRFNSGGIQRARPNICLYGYSDRRRGRYERVQASIEARIVSHRILVVKRSYSLKRVSQVVYNVRCTVVVGGKVAGEYGVEYVPPGLAGPLIRLRKETRPSRASEMAGKEPLFANKKCVP